MWLGFRVWGLGFKVWGFTCDCRSAFCSLMVEISTDLDWDLGFGVWGLGFGVWGLGFKVWGLGLMFRGRGGGGGSDFSLSRRCSSKILCSAQGDLGFRV